MIKDVEIAFIVAMNSKRIIGSKGDLPWHISEDLKFFKEKTTGHAIVMGRKTFESMGGGAGGGLPNRHNIIISRKGAGAGEKYKNCDVCDSLSQALEVAASYNSGVIYIIGGGEIFSLAYDLADRLYVTEVDIDIEGDVYFPEITDEWEGNFGDWIDGIDKKTGEKIHYRFIEYTRKT